MTTVDWRGGSELASIVHLADGLEVPLGPVLAPAGEGAVYAIGDRRDWAAKMFHADLNALEAKRIKVSAMTASSPAEAVQSDGLWRCRCSWQGHHERL